MECGFVVATATVLISTIFLFTSQPNKVIYRWILPVLFILFIFRPVAFSIPLSACWLTQFFFLLLRFLHRWTFHLNHLRIYGLRQMWTCIIVPFFTAFSGSQMFGSSYEQYERIDENTKQWRKKERKLSCIVSARNILTTTPLNTPNKTI